MQGRTLGQRRVNAEPLKKGLFEQIAGYQRVVLLLAGFAYAVGYASRALHASENNLGVLPGIRFEYLVAGTLILVPITALGLIIWGIVRSAMALAAWAAQGSKRGKGVIIALLVTMGLSFTAASRGGGWLPFLWIVFALISIFHLIMVGASIQTNESSSPTDAPIKSESARLKWLRKVGSGLGQTALYSWGTVIALLFGLVLLMILAGTARLGAIAVTHIPQEFGGVKPKCGILDLSLEQLSPEIRSLLLSSGQPLDPSSKVVRSRPLAVFTTSEPWVIRLPSAAVREPARSIRLDGNAVLSVEWCP